FSKLTHDSLSLGKSCFLSGIFEFLAERPDSSIRFFEQSAAIYRAIGDAKREATAMSKIGNIYEGQGEYAKATPIFKRYLGIAEQARDTFLLMTAYTNMAGNTYNLHHYPEALQQVKLANAFAAHQKRDFEYEATLQLQSQIYEAMGAPGEALGTLRQYVEHHDSILNVERSRQIAELETRYETEKKESTIVRQQQALAQSRWQFWLVTGGLILALAVGGVLWRLTRQLRRRNEEKEFLIKEIHHRVKNNLQILSSLLHLQARQITDENALDAVREGQNRVDAMGLIHQKLYMGDNVAAVDMPDYLRHLGDTLLESFGLTDERVQIRYAVQALRLDVDTAVPLGLIINELLTNSLKYAFPDGRAGQVDIALWQDEAGKLRLDVSDNGVGKAGAPALKGSTAFGTNLVQVLSKKLKGSLQTSEAGEGYSTQMVFEQYKTA
ncbi:MAG: tetratricopeptide repeat protein, partial [Saprospiraceae bacterium]|nr:tetratricopeptide repeat protein [Saprospiraceae bacterium]